MTPDIASEAVEVRCRSTRGSFSLDVDFSFPGRGVTALFGPSGCGKTSVLRLIAGLDRMDDGRISVKGAVWQDGARGLPIHRRPIGYVFQEASLFTHMSVRANLTYGRRRTRAGGTLDVDEVVRLLGLGHLLDRLPAKLSGGERQRVAIGRALLSAPEILLMDEPLASLDRFAKNDILPYLERLHDELAIPVLYVSHDLAEVERLADRVVLLEAGKVVASGPVHGLVTHPDLPFAELPDAASVLPATVVRYDAEYGLTTLLVGGAEFVVPGEIGAKGSRHRLRVVASDVSICRLPPPDGISILNTLAAHVTDIREADKHQVTVFMKIGAEGNGPALLARITRKSCDAISLRKGDAVHALVKSVALLRNN